MHGTAQKYPGKSNLSSNYIELFDTKKAINDLNLKVETESELMSYSDFFKNVVDIKEKRFIIYNYLVI